LTPVSDTGFPGITVSGVPRPTRLSRALWATSGATRSRRPSRSGEPVERPSSGTEWRSLYSLGSSNARTVKGDVRTIPSRGTRPWHLKYPERPERRLNLFAGYNNEDVSPGNRCKLAQKWYRRSRGPNDANYSLETRACQAHFKGAPVYTSTGPPLTV
jgi:hypothetical protein